MALTPIVVDGFDHYPTAANDATLGLQQTWAPAGTGAPTITFVTGFRGRGKAIHVSHSLFQGRIQRPIPASTQLSQHMAFRMTEWDGDNIRPIFTWRDFSAGTQFALQAHPNRKIGLYRGYGTTLLAESALALNQNVVHRFNFAFDFSNPVSGSAQMWIDGSLANGFSISNTDLLATANNTVDMVCVDSQGYGSNADMGHRFDVDDFVLCNGAAQNIGELELITQGPTSDIQKQWTPLSGVDNYPMVDEIPPNADTDYNSSTVVGNIDYQGFPVLPTTPDSIFCLTQILAARKEEAGTRSIAAALKQTGETIGTVQNLTTQYEWYYEHYLKNPETVAAWLLAERNAAGFGYKDAA